MKPDFVFPLLGCLIPGCLLVSCVYPTTPVPDMPYRPQNRTSAYNAPQPVQPIPTPAPQPVSSSPSTSSWVTSLPGKTPAATKAPSPSQPTSAATATPPPPRTSSHITQPTLPPTGGTSAPATLPAPTTQPAVTQPTAPQPATGKAAVDPSLITNDGPIPYATRVEGDPTRVYNPIDPTKKIRIIDKKTGQPYPSGKKLKVRNTNFFFYVP